MDGVGAQGTGRHNGTPPAARVIMHGTVLPRRAVRAGPQRHRARGDAARVDVVSLRAFGTLLRRYRTAADLTQEELAERAGVSVRRLGDLERGAPHLPRPDTIALLIRALGLSPQDATTLADAGRRLALAVPAQATHDDPATPPFVGRRPDLALLEHHVVGKGPPLLVVAGDPGMGKTRLLHAAVPRALLHGLRVLEGGCQRRGGQTPFAPLLDAVQGYIGSRSLAHLRLDLKGCAWLVRLLPELATGPIEPLPAWVLPPEQERRLMFAAVTRFLANVGGPAGTLLVLDDLQWADSDALTLLDTLVRSAAQIPLRVVGAYRHTEVRAHDPLSVLLADLAHAGLATQRQLSPLASAETAQLVAGLLEGHDDEDGALQAALVECTGGVPFYVMSCAQALRLPQADQEPGTVLPWTVTQSIRQRRMALPEEAQEVLGIAALIGRVVSLALLVDLATRAEEQVLAGLDALVQAHLLEEHGGDSYHFAHDIIREAVEADLGIGRRTLLHRRIAEALEQQPGDVPVEALAYHYMRSDNQEKALHYLERAGDWAQRQGAHTAAQRCYRDLVERLDRLGRAPDAARAREKLAAASHYIGCLDVASEVLEQAATTYHGGGDVEGLRRTLALIGRLHAWRATPAEGLARIQPLMETLGDGAPSAGIAALYAALAWLFLSSDRPGESVRAAERAVELARAVGDDRILADAETRRGVALIGLGQREESRRVLEGILPLVQTVGDVEILVRLSNNLARNYLSQGAFAACTHHLDRALAIDQHNDDVLNMTWTLSGLGEVLFYHGEWEAARAHLERAAELMRSTEWFLLSVTPLIGLARLHGATGEGARAILCMEEALAKARGHTQKWVWPTVPLLLAELDLLDDRPESALQRLVPLPGEREMTEDSRTTVLPLLAWVHLAVGDNVTAGAVVDQAIQRATAQDNRLVLVEALRVSGMVMVRQHRWAEARRILDEGLSLARRFPYPYAEARLLHAYGGLHTQTGAPDLARARLEEGLAVFRRLGARKDIERVEQDRAALPQVVPL